MLGFGKMKKGVLRKYMREMKFTGLLLENPLIVTRGLENLSYS